MPYFAVKDGTKLYYEQRGTGETILFVHGLSSSHFELRNFIVCVTTTGDTLPQTVPQNT